MNPDFDTEIDQWVFVGQLFRAINLSPVGDYDFEGIDTREYQVLAYEVLIALPQKPCVQHVIQLQPEVLNINNPENFCYCPDATNLELPGTDTGEVSKESRSCLFL